MQKGEKIYYKLARPDGWDFYTGKTINYRDNIGKTVKVPSTNDINPKVCSSSVIHASLNPNDCFVGASIPCSAYKVRGIPVCGDNQKNGFKELRVIKELTDLDALFKWRYSEAANSVNPFKLPKTTPSEDDINLLRAWASVRGSVCDSVWDSVRASVRGSVCDSVWVSVWASVRGSVCDSVRAYIGYIFIPVVKEWIDSYPYMSAVQLWKRGLVPSYDGKTWRLHSGEKAEIVYEMSV